MPLNVGIIGVSSDASWGREAHVPGARAVDGLALAAIATRDQQSADQLAGSLSVPRGYGDPFDLVTAPDIDIVTVATPVPAHHDLIVAALEAGKHVLTEWPVGTSTQQTEQIAELAENSDLCTAVGLQARVNPAAVRERELVASAAIGHILSVTVLSTTAAFGPTVPAGARYLEDPAVGMNLATIQTAHTIDFALGLTGPLTSLSTLATIQYPRVTSDDDGAVIQRTVPDHLLVQGRLATGGALAVQVVGGRAPGDTPFRIDVVGEAGTLTLTGGAVRGFQAGLLDLRHNGDTVRIDDPRPELSGSAANVAGVYAALRDDILHTTRNAPNFTHAAQLSHLIDDLLTSADQQRSITPTAPWPN